MAVAFSSSTHMYSISGHITTGSDNIIIYSNITGQYWSANTVPCCTHIPGTPPVPVGGLTAGFRACSQGFRLPQTCPPPSVPPWHACTCFALPVPAPAHAARRDKQAAEERATTAVAELEQERHQAQQELSQVRYGFSRKQQEPPPLQNRHFACLLLHLSVTIDHLTILCYVKINYYRGLYQFK